MQMSTPAPPLLTTVNSQVFLQMVFIFEGLATLSAFELAIACSLGQHLVLGGKEEKKKRDINMNFMQEKPWISSLKNKN